MKRLIINADDYGWSRANIDAIIDLYRSRLVTSTSVMTTMPSYEYGIEKLKANPGLGAGVHLTIMDGKPVLPADEVASLVNRETGTFLSWNEIKRRKKMLLSRELNAEYEAQIKRLIESGISPDHLDVHTILPYFIPKWRRIIIELAKKYELPIRTPIGFDYAQKHKSAAAHTPFPPFIIRFLGKRFLQQLKTNRIRHPDYFISDFSDNDGEAVIRDKTEQLCRLLDELKDGVTELLTHPSYEDETWRRIEYSVLKDEDIRKRLQEGEIELSSFSCLS